MAQAPDKHNEKQDEEELSGQEDAERWYVVTSSKKTFGSSTSREETLESENIQEKSLPGDGENTNVLIHQRERGRGGYRSDGGERGFWEGVFWGAL